MLVLERGGTKEDVVAENVIDGGRLATMSDNDGGWWMGEGMDGER